MCDPVRGPGGVESGVEADLELFDEGSVGVVLCWTERAGCYRSLSHGVARGQARNDCDVPSASSCSLPPIPAPHLYHAAVAHIQSDSMARPPTRPAPPSAAPRPSNAFPLSSHVATSTSPRSSTLDESAFASHTSSTLSRALATVDTLKHRLEWVERLCEPSISLSLMREALSILDVSSYEDLIEERWSEGNCPYPPCGRKAGGVYVSSLGEGRVKVRIQAGALQVVGSDGYCTNKCEARSEWFRSMLGTERRELLEDVERRRREVVASTGVRVIEPTPVIVEDIVVEEEEVEEVVPDALMKGLTIMERPTPAMAPSAPSAASSSMSFERPRSSHAPPPPTIHSQLPIDEPLPSPSPSTTTPTRRRIRPSLGSLPPASPTSPLSTSTSPAPLSLSSIFPESMSNLPPPVFSTPERDDSDEWGEKLGIDGEEVGDEVRRGFVEALRLKKEEDLAQAAERRFEEEEG